LIKKKFKKFSAVFFLQFLVILTLDPDPYPNSLEMLDPNPYPDSMNPDPQLWEDEEEKTDYIVKTDLLLDLLLRWSLDRLASLLGLRLRGCLSRLRLRRRSSFSRCRSRSACSPTLSATCNTGFLIIFLL